VGTIPQSDVKALYASIRHKAGRARTDSEQGESIPEDVPFLTHEEQQQEQEFLLVLGREMTNPTLPAYKYEITSPLLPAYKYEILDAAQSSKVEEDDDATVLRKAVRPPTRGRKTGDFFRAEEDDDATIIRKVVHPPTRGRKTKDFSRIEDGGN